LNERIIHRVFEASILLKALHALVECAGGVLLYLVTTQDIAALVNWLTQSELVEDPRDIIAVALVNLAQGFSVSSKSFYAFYLLSHGVVKLALAAGLLANRLWAYPATLVVLVLFIAYQVYRYSYTFAPGLLVLTVFDFLVLWLVWHEYRLVQRLKAGPAP
jgi:uncharacterized membrane protein